MESKVIFDNVDDCTEKPEGGVKESVVVEPQNATHKIHCLTIIGQIEGHVVLPPQNKTTKYEHVIPQLVNIQEDNTIEGLLVILNTVGGDVEAGLAIAEMIASMSKPTVSLVLGGGHSIGVPLAVAANYSFIVPSATMTIHPIRMSGVVIGTSQTYDHFNKVQERVVSFISKNSRISFEDFTALVHQTGVIANDVGTILFGEEAVHHGIIDEVGGVSKAFDYLNGLINSRKEQQ